MGNSLLAPKVSLVRITDVPLKVFLHMSLTRNQIISISIGAVIIAVAFFFIGWAVGKHHKTAAHSMTGAYGMTQGGGMRTGGMGGRASGGFATGTILSMDATSITIATGNGTGSKTVYFDTTTPILKSTAGSVGDLQTGDTVTVTGTPNADGSLTAQSISIRPAMTTQSQGSAAGSNAPMIPANQ